MSKKLGVQYIFLKQKVFQKREMDLSLLLLLFNNIPPVDTGWTILQDNRIIKSTKNISIWHKMLIIFN